MSNDRAKAMGHFLEALGQPAPHRIDPNDLAGYRGPVIFVDPEDDERPGGPGEMMICQVCEVPLNRMSAGPEDYDAEDFDFVWVHSRSWRTYDHEPSPTLATEETKPPSVCDFCGTEAVMQTAYTGDRLRVGGGDGTLQDFGTSWSACVDCTEFIDNQDIDGLLARAKRVAPITAGRPKREQDQTAEGWLSLWTAFLPTVHTRMHIGPTRQPAALNPRMMPKLQHGLVRHWKSDAVRVRFTTNRAGTYTLPIPGLHAGDENRFIVRFPPGADIPDNVWTNHTDHLVAGIWTSDLYWISPEFTRLAVMAGKDFEKLLISREELPSKFGFMVFAEPIGEIQRPGGAAGIRAVSWTLVPGGVWINLYMQGEDADPDIDVTEMREAVGYLMCPNTGSGIVFDEAVPRPEESRYDVIATIFATWFLMQQPGVAEQDKAPVDKKIARSYQRQYQRPLPDVKLVDLIRRPRRPATEGTRVGTPLSVRVYRRGHWKRQFYGPGRALRKTIYVSAYIAGPEGAPLKQRPPVVKVVR